LARFSIRLWFCLAVAVAAAAIADPLVEWASNAGCFGPGSFTDHSNADVLPAIVVGVGLAAIHVLLRVRAMLSNPAAPPNLLRLSNVALHGSVARLLPATFALQIFALFSMETVEQHAIYGHGLGGTVWLGGPALVSLATHAAVCAGVFLVAAFSVRSLAAATARVIRAALSRAAFPAHGAPPIATRDREVSNLARLRFVLSSIGERAPPLLTA